MPFSRSRSIESITRSFTSWFARNAPDCHSMASTSVVLPWSTWATMATLRRSSRVTSMSLEASGGSVSDRTRWLRFRSGAVRCAATSRGSAGVSAMYPLLRRHRMKRAGILLLALAALAALVAPAQAARPAKAKAVAQSRPDVLAYWTKERMRNAIPLDVVRGAAQRKRPKVPYPFTRYEPATYNPAHGKVFFSDGGTNYVCSGTALTSGNESVVWTAGHCVNEGPGAFFTNWAFVPAYKDGARPYGTWTARTLLTTSPWRNFGDISYDEGAAVVSANASGQTLTDVVGSRGIGFNRAAQQHYLSHGYPAARPFTGGRMFICEADLALRDTSASPPTMGIGCDMTGGSSGGGWVVGNDVLSVNSYGYGNLRNVVFGPYQDGVAQQLYASASGS